MRNVEKIVKDNKLDEKPAVRSLMINGKRRMIRKRLAVPPASGKTKNLYLKKSKL